MWRDFTKTKNFIKKNYLKVSTKISKVFFDIGIHKDSIHQVNGNFLQSCCLTFKPSYILEIGTWVGNRAYCMAAATTKTKIYTCDLGDDNFKTVKGFEKHAKSIVRNPNTHSSSFLKNFIEK